MPIRMVPDDNQGKQQQRRVPTQNQSGRGGSGLGGLMKFIPAILGFLIKRPKLLILLLIIAAVVYFMGDGCSMSPPLDDSNNSNTTQVEQNGDDLTKGATLDPDEFDKAEVYEPLDISRNTLPESYSLAQYCPPRKNQGYQGSCVGWASSYAARTIMEARSTGKNPASVAFSPSSLYNQIALPNCQGAYINNAMDVMKQRGVLPWADFPYDESNCTSKPNNYGIRKMAEYRTKGYNRLTKGGDPRSGIDLIAIKQNISKGAPVVIGMLVGGSFMQPMQGQEMWFPSRSDFNMRGFGGHAMCVIGYDDYKEGGAFQIMNSWGKEWGVNGIGWVRYNDFEFFTKEAYGLYPMGNATDQNPNKFEMAMGLVANQGNQYIPLKQVSGNYFETDGAIPVLTKFKMEVTNTIACYTYIFGMNTDGSTYTLFPYTAKHSPYCGITGTRVFPKDYSMQADKVGNKDFFAVIITKQPVEYTTIEQAINQASGNTYQEKVNTALAGVLKQGIRFQGNGKQIGFSTDTNGEEAVAMVIGVNKR